MTQASKVSYYTGTTDVTPTTTKTITFSYGSNSILVKNIHSSAANLSVSFDSGVTYVPLVKDAYISIQDISRGSIIVKSTDTASVNYEIIVTSVF